ncbi:hypothetical protein CEUSTIGMA_g6097.t1 [Chlamydomonas eustigma]|uniref:PGG domain-containing protein n=1 Tax=Chlamydomonas eustigma TaxID=1157962 RepID=A0A250X6X0_9CHLO|nr:hypothetical protein CEUSTIGMA_g6097.t1 [Chlamydomonas eustigma]|eukprot:GAX78659.1 hypothetical protein CEUSTIGMA_g6097.t1 [Chlamydomonas eustigma]
MFWTNISLVSALLLAVSYPSAIAPINSDDPDKANAVSIAATFSGLSLVLSLSVIVISVIYLIEIDNCTTERDLTDFIDVNSPVVDILTGIFSASVVLLLAAALTSMFITFGQTEFLTVTCVAGAITLLGIVFASILAGHNRFRLWVRYDSPEGKKMVEKLKRKQMEKLEALKADLIFQEKDLSALKEALDLMDVKERVEGPRMQP